jgi:hypothetical protein
MIISKSELKKSNGKFFSIKYMKKDGTTESYVVRSGVSKGVQGTGHAPLPENEDKYVKLFALKRDCHRTFLLDSIIECSLLKDEAAAKALAQK